MSGISRDNPHLPSREKVDRKVNLPHYGNGLTVRALKSDGHAYRWWSDTVESTTADTIVTFSAAGKVILGPGGGWVSRFHGRTTYWYDRPYSVAEIYEPNGNLLELYVHIASPARLEDNTLIYTDHELDVVLKRGKPPIVVDEDEFAEAAERYGYTAEFQAACYAAVSEVLGFIESWQPTGVPTRP